MSSRDATWNFLNPASKDRVLDVLGREIDETLVLLGDPDRWHEPTACEGWDVRDMAGHLLDASEALLDGFERARGGGADPDAVGFAGMAEAYNEGALAFRGVARDEVLDRLRNVMASLMKEFASLSDDEWSTLVVTDRYTGPLPAMVHVIAWLGGFVVHGWDVREGTSSAHAIASDAADLIVPFVPLLWQATADTTRVEEPYAVGIRTTGRNGGDIRFEISREGVRFRYTEIDDCPAILEADPGTLVLVAHGRVNGGTVSGDRRLVADFLSLFIPL